ncbi:MAG: MBL fold metallo-hydrolase [Planctomycetota bacterium]|nr:MAG: MBL fold metallo-hydrolase [Planctomycetota bacterium]
MSDRAPRTAAAERVGDGVYRLPLPVPFDEDGVNAYALLGEQPALVDVGPRTEQAWQALCAQLDALGLAPHQLAHVIITHAHVDHHGNLGRLVREAPAVRVHCHRDDAAAIFEFTEEVDRRAALLEPVLVHWGMEPSRRAATLAAYRGFARMAESVDRLHLEPLAGERAEVVFGQRRLVAIHTPGHSPGQIVLHLQEGQGALFSADHILERITPNPAVYAPPYRGRRTGLVDYLASLQALRPLAAAWVLPGHGPPFQGLVHRIEGILLHHERRAQQILALLQERAASVAELVPRLWGDLDAVAFFMACREVHGHLDLLVERGACRLELGPDGTARYQARSNSPRRIMR